MLYALVLVSGSAVWKRKERGMNETSEVMGKDHTYNRAYW